MRLRLNGHETDLEVETVRDLLEREGIDPERSGIAVAVNEEIVRRAAWSERRLAEGDVVEVITATVGG